MNKPALATLLLSIALTTQAQKPTMPCRCPESPVAVAHKPEKVFDLGHGHLLGFCGYISKKHNDTTYREFILFQCGKKDYLPYWEESACKITQDQDTLILTEQGLVPVGKDFETISLPYKTYKVFFRGPKLIDTSFYRSDLPKYSATQIKKILAQYATLKVTNNYDTLLLISNRLCWAYVSGSKEAEKCLHAIKTKYGPFDGGIKEEFDDIWEEYESWKKEFH